MPFAKISEKRLAKTISIAVSGFCLLSLSYYFMCHVTDIYLMHCIIVKLREREGQGVDLGRSLKGHLWMVDGGWWYTFP